MKVPRIVMDGNQVQIVFPQKLCGKFFCKGQALPRRDPFIRWKGNDIMEALCTVFFLPLRFVPHHAPVSHLPCMPCCSSNIGSLHGFLRPADIAEIMFQMPGPVTRFTLFQTQQLCDCHAFFSLISGIPFRKIHPVCLKVCSVHRYLPSLQSLLHGPPLRSG